MRVVMMALLFIIAAATSQARAQVPEIPNPQLQDIAMVTTDAWGRPIIVYNPVLCAQMGPLLCGFYRRHEYGHIALGHTILPLWPAQKEFDADCWAAKNASAAEFDAAIRWFMSGGGTTPVHGTGPQRAQRLMACRQG